MLKLHIQKFVFFLILFGTFAPEVTRADILYSVRVRPIALATEVPGAEFYLSTDSGYFIGGTFHYFSGQNDTKNTALTNTETGLRFGRVFPSGVENQGWFIMGNINYYRTNVSNFYTVTGQDFSLDTGQMGEALFLGYQFRARLIGKDHWDLRLGLGCNYKSEIVQNFVASNGTVIPVGIRERLDPTLEFTLGYVF